MVHTCSCISNIQSQKGVPGPSVLPCSCDNPGKFDKETFMPTPEEWKTSPHLMLKNATKFGISFLGNREDNDSMECQPSYEQEETSMIPSRPDSGILYEMNDQLASEQKGDVEFSENCFEGGCSTPQNSKSPKRKRLIITKGEKRIKEKCVEDFRDEYPSHMVFRSEDQCTSRSLADIKPGSPTFSTNGVTVTTKEEGGTDRKKSSLDTSYSEVPVKTEGIWTRSKRKQEFKSCLKKLSQLPENKKTVTFSPSTETFEIIGSSQLLWSDLDKEEREKSGARTSKRSTFGNRYRNNLSGVLNKSQYVAESTLMTIRSPNPKRASKIRRSGSPKPKSKNVANAKEKNEINSEDGEMLPEALDFVEEIPENKTEFEETEEASTVPQDKDQITKNEFEDN